MEGPRFIIDAGPFIHLAQIGQLRLLKKLPRIIIPASVAAEIGRGGRKRGPGLLSNWRNVKIIPAGARSPGSLIPAVQNAPLQTGERDCLALACELGACVFLTDDLAARTVAERLGLEVHGTVGVIAYAARRKWLTVENSIEALHLLDNHSSLFITRTIVEGAIRRLKELAQRPSTAVRAWNKFQRLL